MTLVTPEARLASTKTGSVARSRWPDRSRRSSARTRCWASRNPCVRTAAFGCPVLPLVNVTSAAVSLGNSATTSVGAPAVASTISLRVFGSQPADRDGNRNLPDHARHQAKEMSFGDGDERVRRVAAAALVDVLAARRRVDNHRDGAETPEPDQDCIQRDRHRAQDERLIARLQAGRVELRRDRRRQSIEFGKADASMRLDDGQGVAALAGPLAQDLGDVHALAAAAVARTARSGESSARIAC